MTHPHIPSAFLETGVLSVLDATVASRLASRAGECATDVVLALALAVRAPRHGHVHIDLAQVQIEHLQASQDTQTTPPTLPEDRGAWIEHVRQSVLVSDCGQPGQRPFQLHGTALYTDRSWTYQHAVASRFKAWSSTPLLRPNNPEQLRLAMSALFPDAAAGQQDQQALAVATAIMSPFTVVTGGPGTGKTWTVRNLLALALLDHPRDSAPLRIALAAPTGKATFRLQESIQSDLTALVEALRQVLAPELAEDIADSIRAIQAKTIHRLLGWQPHNPTRFRFNRDSPLPADLVIVDETSMVDLAMMSKLTEALLPSAQLVLVGDPHQLASVEAGSVLADLCRPVDASAGPVSQGTTDALSWLDEIAAQDADASAATTRLGDHIVPLVQNRRFSDTSNIGRFARAVVASPADPEEAFSAFETEQGDLQRISPPLTLSGPLLQSMLEGYQEVMDLAHSGPGTGESTTDFVCRLLQAFDSFRILCAHRRGPLSVTDINHTLTSRFRNRHPGTGGHWIGRPILITENDYTSGRFNGDTGITIAVDGQLVVVFPDARDEGEPFVQVPVARLPAHATCFAMTIHRSQGSQWSTVQVVLPQEPSPILTRELLYTGVTRASQSATVVASPDVLRLALNTPIQRASGLGAALWRDQDSQ